MQKIKLLLCIEELQMNGVMTAFKEFLRMLDRNVFEIYLFAYKQGGPYWEECVPDDVIVLPEIAQYRIARDYSKNAFRYAFLKGHWNLGFKRFLYPILRHMGGKKYAKSLYFNGPEIPGAYDIAIGFVPSSLFYLIQNKVTAKKRLIWQHSDYRYCPEEWQFASFEKLDALVCVGKEIENQIRKDYRELDGRLFTVHNIVDFSGVIEKSKYPLEYPRIKGLPRLVTVGRFSPPKNQHFIVDVVQILKNKGYKFEWFLIGDDTHEYGQKNHFLCEQAGVEDILKFTGQLINPQPLVKSADLAVFPSVFEGWGLTVTEALAIGVPVLVSDIPVFHEQCNTEDIISLDPNKFANAIEKRFKILQNGEKLICNRDCLKLVSKENVKKEFEEVLNQIGVSVV